MRLPMRLLTTEEAARGLGVHPRTIRKLAAAGRLTNRGKPRRMRFDVEDVRDLWWQRQTAEMLNAEDTPMP